MLWKIQYIYIDNTHIIIITLMRLRLTASGTIGTSFSLMYGLCRNFSRVFGGEACVVASKACKV